VLVRVATPYDLTTLDPHAVDWASHTGILANLYEPLVTMDAEMRLRPALAESWESPDPLTWVFHLRRGVTFHSGRTLSAADVVYTMHRLRTRSDLEMSTYLEGVTEVAAVDRDSVRLRTRAPTRVLLNKLVNVPMVREGSGERLAWASDGTGPFRLVGPWQRGKPLRLARYQGYWGKAPAVAAVEFDPGQADALGGLRAGRYQVVQCPSRAGTDRDAARFLVQSADTLSVKFLGFDVARDTTPHCSLRANPFRQRSVRQAIHLALDRQQLSEDLSSDASPLAQGVPRFVFGFNPDLQAPVPDLGRARALLAAAGVGSGFSATLLTPAQLTETARLVAGQLAPLGIRLQVEAVSQEEHARRLAAGDGTVWLNRFSCATGDASDFLNDVLHSRDAPGHYGAFNDGGWASPELDRLIEASLGLEPPGTRLSALQHILSLAAEDLPVVALYEDREVFAVDRSLLWTPRRDGAILAAEMSPRGDRP
jgi:peptide/nickel transport system substrate-binding protein